eukprot:12881993-Prorocentrum_lima.AAC.1
MSSSTAVVHLVLPTATTPPQQPLRQHRLVGNPHRSCMHPFFKSVLGLARCVTLPLIISACMFATQ